MMKTLPAPRGGEVAYRTFGTDGPWLILIHGWCGSAAHWDRIAPALSADRRILAMSHPGFGGTAAPPKAGRTIDAMAEAVIAVLDDAGARSALLLGHSMGGPIATEAAILLGPRAEGLIGLDTLSDRGYYGRQTAEEIARRRRLFEADFAGVMRRMVDDIARPSTPETLRAAIAEQMSRVPAGFALGRQGQSLRLGRGGALAAGAVPRPPPELPACRAPRPSRPDALFRPDARRDLRVRSFPDGGASRDDRHPSAALPREGSTVGAGRICAFRRLISASSMTYMDTRSFGRKSTAVEER